MISIDRLKIFSKIIEFFIFIYLTLQLIQVDFLDVFGLFASAFGLFSSLFIDIIAEAERRHNLE
ncbi:MAG: hypothetical protein Q7S56_01610 [Nanoarchaeota archaeon]|nr:hypothetical protein [Nanoarchaeota archaeon]